MSKTFVIADLHGRFDLLERALKRITISAPFGGTIVFLGDYIDRGPQSREVVTRLMSGPASGWKWVVLKGNHEELMALSHDAPNRDWWLENGGVQTLQSYGGHVPADHVKWVGKLPMLHVDAHRVYAHAGVQPGKELAAQDASDLLWQRYPAGRDIAYPGYHIVHGHTPNRDGPELYPGRTNLDTGAVFFGRLVVGVFDDNEPGGPIALLEVQASDAP